METSDNLEKIREAVVKANPEIMELKFGCKAIWIRSESEFRKAAELEVIVVGNKENGAVDILSDGINLTQRSYTVLDTDLKEILGRPIRLADVILAIPDYAERISDEGERILLMLISIWDMRDDNLFLQSPKVIEVIASLLT